MPSLPPATPAFSFASAPIPLPPFPAGRGRPKVYFAGGYRPRHPCPEPPAALTVPVVLVPGGIPCREPLPVGFAANYGFSPGNARGEAPCIRKLKVSPFPPGRGLGGWGQNQKPKAGTAGDKEGKPPLRTPQRQGQPATSRASPPPGEWFALAPGAAWVQPRGCKGRSPLHKITLGSPFPPGRGVGGWGQ